MLLDDTVESASRSLARRGSRRGVLGRIGRWMTAGAALPLLPIARGSAAQAQAVAEVFAATAQSDDDTECNYWRYCGIDGSLCSCCGGTPTSCPPGTQASPSAWIGSCINPTDGKTYLVAYRDCCGKDSCGRCSCLGVEGESPAYRPQLNTDIIWCFGSEDMTYHCSAAAVIGEVD